jgi:GTP-binding protein LepA
MEAKGATDPDLIRNFCIISHVDHGKSTLSDRILEICQAVDPRKMREQYLDSMDIERERGITIKAQAVRVRYKDFVYNLIDTPGHVDFTYEVSRSMAACEGAVLLVDATQGIQAQTLANTYLALENDLEVIPVLNKIDLPAADPDRCMEELKTVLGIKPEEVLMISAKTGEGVPRLLDAIAERIPPPRHGAGKLQALVFDSAYDQYRGVVALVRVVSGRLAEGQRILLAQAGTVHVIEELGFMTPEKQRSGALSAGEVGYLIAGIKEVAEIRPGDTITTPEDPAEPLPGYRQPKPMVFCGFYPASGEDFEQLREALAKLRLNDSAIVFEPETSAALGFGFRCGFLGLLHMDIVRERLEREFGMALVATAPSVAYEVVLTDGTSTVIKNPNDLPPRSRIRSLKEPVLAVRIITPAEHIGAVMDLVRSRRGVQEDMAYLSKERVELRYKIPLAEVVLDFFDQLKSRSRGYATMDYELVGYEDSDLVRVEILVNHVPVDAFSAITHREKAAQVARSLVKRLAELIPRQLFDVPIQGAVDGRIVARETIRARRKDVIAKCYGGDVTRKKKLLEKQREGKKRMKMLGQVEVPQEVFIEALRI